MLIMWRYGYDYDVHHDDEGDVNYLQAANGQVEPGSVRPMESARLANLLKLGNTYHL